MNIVFLAFVDLCLSLFYFVSFGCLCLAFCTGTRGCLIDRLRFVLGGAVESYASIILVGSFCVTRILFVSYSVISIAQMAGRGTNGEYPYQRLGLGSFWVVVPLVEDVVARLVAPVREPGSPRHQLAIHWLHYPFVPLTSGFDALSYMLAMIDKELLRYSSILVVVFPAGDGRPLALELGASEEMRDLVRRLEGVFWVVESSVWPS